MRWKKRIFDERRMKEGLIKREKKKEREEKRERLLEEREME